jgi:holo-[acyl-carrier-protein] synthase
MIVGSGIDLVNISRIKKIILKWDRRFLNKIYTVKEMDYCEQKSNNRYHSYAGIFAAKEACAKALGTGFRDIKWKDIEINNDILGKPIIYLSSDLKDKFKEKEIDNTHLSISHTEKIAVAMVIIEK